MDPSTWAQQRLRALAVKALTDSRKQAFQSDVRRVIGRNNQKNKIAAFQVRSHDFARSELLDIQRIVAENEQTLRKAWDDACDRFQLMSAWDGFMPRRGYGAQPGVSTLGTIQPKRVALNGRKITWANLAHIAP